MIPYRYLEDFGDDVLGLGFKFKFQPLEENDLYRKFGFEQFLYNCAFDISNMVRLYGYDLSESDYMMIVSEVLAIHIQLAVRSGQTSSDEPEYAFAKALNTIDPPLRAGFRSVLCDMFKQSFQDDKHNLAMDRVNDLELSGRHKVKFCELMVTHDAIKHPKFRKLVLGDKGEEKRSTGLLAYVKSMKTDLEFSDIMDLVNRIIRPGDGKEKMTLILKQCFFEASKLENITLVPKDKGGLDKFRLLVGDMDNFQSFVSDKKYNFDLLHVQVKDVLTAIDGIDLYLNGTSFPKGFSYSNIKTLIPAGREAVGRELSADARRNLGEVLEDYLSYCFAEAAQKPNLKSADVRASRRVADSGADKQP